ncbi:MAG: hypothetical protein Q8N94_11990 [Methanoregula sp.]|nr:hypothetical protein [Methanoregula sp.]
MEKLIKMGIFTVLIIGMVLMSGCTDNPDSSVPTSTPTPQVVYVTVLVTPAPPPHTVYVVVPVTVTPTYEHKVVAVTTTRQGNNIVVTYQGGADENMVSGLNCEIGTVSHQWTSPKNGESKTFSGGTTGKDRVIVTATFTDVGDRVILDKYV